MAQQNDPLANELQNGLSELRRERLAALDDSVNVYLAMQSFLLNEAQRIEKKLGPNHDRSKQITNRLQSNIELCHQLEVEGQLTRIELPEVATDGALIYGRVADQDGLGIDRLIVYLADLSGARLNISGPATDGSGFFAIALDSETL